MPMKKDICRASERTRMLRMQAEGYSPEQISNAVSVKLDMVNRVLSGEFAEQENAAKEEQKRLDKERAEAKQKAEEERDARVAAAAAAGAAAAVNQPKASKPARELAEANGIDLADIEGTGSNGNVTKGDVQKEIAARVNPE